MEKTRELAAVIRDLGVPRMPLYGLNPSPEESLVENSDWSGRHVRLKYQMMISVFLLFLITGTKVKEINLLGIVKYGDDFPKNSFFWMLLTFSIFSMLSFSLRSVFESTRWSSLRKDMKNLISNIRTNEIRLKELFDFQEKNVFSQKISSLVTGPNDDYGEEFQTLFLELNENKKRGVLYELSHALNQINYDVSILKKRLEYLRPGYHPKVTSYSNSLRFITSAVSDIEGSIENIEGYLKDNRTKKTYYKEISRALARYSDALSAIETKLPELEPKSLVFKNREAFRDGIYFAQNYGFSVILPLCGAFGIVSISIFIKLGCLSL